LTSDTRELHPLFASGLPLLGAHAFRASKPTIRLSLVVSCCSPVEFKKIATSTGMGMVVMGFVGFFVKIIHIPINNILMGV